MKFSTKILLRLNKLFKAPVHPLNLQDEGVMSYAMWQYNKGADAVMALASGKIDCVVIDNEPAKAFVAANEGLVILETSYAVEDYAICLQKDSPLTAKINEALEALIEDGTVQKIVDKYIPAE